MEQSLFDHIVRREKELKETSDSIWELAELKFEEHASMEKLCILLEGEGFIVEKGVGGLDTAFIASFSVGSGHPVIGLLGEYDALSGMSQIGGLNEQQSIVNQNNGHGCGHNLLGVGMCGSAIALRHVLEENQIDGTIRLYGCPAEEGGSGKTYMVRAGLFNDVDVALTWHPGDDNSVSQGTTLANIQSYFRFKGISSHAAISPHLGRSALDAVELMNVGVNYLREHIIPESRVHYAVTNTGGHSPNVVQADAEVLYLIRAPLVKDAQHIYERIQQVARGAALMTGTEVEIIFDKACSNVIPNKVLYQEMYTVFESLELPTYTEQELDCAKKIASTIPGTDSNDVIARDIKPLQDKEWAASVSTDVGDVSWIVPTVQCGTACFVKGTHFHSWQMVSQSVTSFAHKGMMHASKVVAATALRLFLHQSLITAARSEWKERLQGLSYTSPIPAHVHPPCKRMEESIG